MGRMPQRLLRCPWFLWRNIVGYIGISSYTPRNSEFHVDLKVFYPPKFWASKRAFCWIACSHQSSIDRDSKHVVLAAPILLRPFPHEVDNSAAFAEISPATRPGEMWRCQSSLSLSQDRILKKRRYLPFLVKYHTAGADVDERKKVINGHSWWLHSSQSTWILKILFIGYLYPMELVHRTPEYWYSKIFHC